jgi:threonine dehydratase
MPVTIVMPADAYPNKIQACRDLGAEVVLATMLDHVELLDDGIIFAAQKRLVRSGEVVEPAGAASSAFVFHRLPGAWLAGRSRDNPLRVCAVVSGGNPDPAQLEELRSSD